METDETEAFSTPDTQPTPSPGTLKEAQQEPSEGFGIAAKGNEFKSSSQSVADQLDEDNKVESQVSEIISNEEFTDEEIEEISKLSDTDIDKLVEETMSDEGEETETSESEEETSEPQAEQTDDIDDLLSNRVQRRIDKLTAEKKSANEENDLLKARIAALETKFDQSKEPKEEKKSEALSDDQIAKAIQRGIDDGDTSVIVDAIKYITGQVKEQTVKEQQEIAQKQAEAVQKRNTEWFSLAKEYSPEAYQSELLKSDPDFNLTDQGSKLYRLANRLFSDKGYGQQEQGQSRAVREAYSILLERKLEGDTKPTPKKNDETEGLKNRLGKEQRKTSILGGANEAEETPSKPLTQEDELSEYISSRNKSKNTKLGVEI
jgi:hypothetical protein